jgi:hypothetical protein
MAKADGVDPALPIAGLLEAMPQVLLVEQQSGEASMADTAILGLRLNEGLDVPAFDARFGKSLDATYGPVITELGALGLLKRENGNLRLTPADAAGERSPVACCRLCRAARFDCRFHCPTRRSPRKPPARAHKRGGSPVVPAAWNLSAAQHPLARLHAIMTLGYVLSTARTTYKFPYLTADNHIVTTIKHSTVGGTRSTRPNQ